MSAYTRIKLKTAERSGAQVRPLRHTYRRRKTQDFRLRD